MADPSFVKTKRTVVAKLGDPEVSITYEGWRWSRNLVGSGWKLGYQTMQLVNGGHLRLLDDPFSTQSNVDVNLLLPTVVVHHSLESLPPVIAFTDTLRALDLEAVVCVEVGKRNNGNFKALSTEELCGGAPTDSTLLWLLFPGREQAAHFLKNVEGARKFNMPLLGSRLLGFVIREHPFLGIFNVDKRHFFTWKARLGLFVSTALMVISATAFVQNIRAGEDAGQFMGRMYTSCMKLEEEDSTFSNCVLESKEGSLNSVAPISDISFLSDPFINGFRHITEDAGFFVYKSPANYPSYNPNESKWAIMMKEYEVGMAGRIHQPIFCVPVCTNSTVKIGSKKWEKDFSSGVAGYLATVEYKTHSPTVDGDTTCSLYTGVEKDALVCPFEATQANLGPSSEYNSETYQGNLTTLLIVFVSLLVVLPARFFVERASRVKNFKEYTTYKPNQLPLDPTQSHKSSGSFKTGILSHSLVNWLLTMLIKYIYISLIFFVFILLIAGLAFLFSQTGQDKKSVMVFLADGGAVFGLGQLMAIPKSAAILYSQFLLAWYQNRTKTDSRHAPLLTSHSVVANSDDSVANSDDSVANSDDSVANCDDSAANCDDSVANCDDSVANCDDHVAIIAEFSHNESAPLLAL